MVSSRVCPPDSLESYTACQELVGPLGPPPFCQRFRAIECDGDKLSRTAQSPTPGNARGQTTVSDRLVQQPPGAFRAAKTQNLSR